MANHGQEDDAPDLGHRLDQEHSRHDRVAGKVTLEEGLIQRDVLQTHGPAARFQFEDAVHQQEWVAMRQHAQDFLNRQLYHRPFS